MKISKHLALFFSAGITLSAFLYFVFSGQLILPQTFSIDGFKIHYYGFILASAIGLAYYLMLKRASSLGFTKDEVENMALVTLIGGFIGARFYHVISSWDYYLNHWTEIVMVWNGGLGIFGAVLGGMFSLFLWHSYYGKTSLWKILDWLAPSVVLGQAIGRFGNLFNYEAYGRPTDLPWKMFVPSEFRIDVFSFNEFFHPLFLYESIACLLILVILLNWTDIAKVLSIKVKTGQVFLLWIILYCLVRLGTETLRLDSQYIGDIKQNFLVSLIALAICLYLLIRLIINPENESK